MTKSEARRLGLIPGRSRTRKPPEVATDAPLRWAIEFNLPCRVVSEANRPGHWAEVRKRRVQQCESLATAMTCARLWHLPMFFMLPVVVTWTHVGPEMDGHDNLRRAFKALTDSMATNWLKVDDDDPRVTWEYAQRPGPAGVEVRIESRPDTPQPSPSASRAAKDKPKTNA
jgi:hypothetical protein